MDRLGSLSVVIPTFNRSRLLRACLDALARQTEPPDRFEVIVVVDGSTDETRTMLATHQTPYRLTVLVQANAGPAVARNAGLRVATGDYCLFLDDDIVAAPDLVRAHLRAQQAHPNTVTLGRIETVLGRDADGFARYMAASWTQHFVELGAGARPLSFRDCWSANVCVPRSALESVGGFAPDVPFVEDVELGYRLHDRGLSFTYVAEAVGHHHYAKRFAAIASDCEKTGAVAVDLARRHPPLLASGELGRFNRWGTEVATLRRLALALAPPTALLALLSRVVDGLPRSVTRYWYRILYDHFFWRGARRGVRDRDRWRQLTSGTVILMYHAFGRRGERASRYVTPGWRFARQMAWLKRRQYHVISLETYVRYRLEHVLPPARSVVITIDDGYADVRTCAYPVLHRYGLPATVFVVTDGVGTVNSWDRDGLGNRPLLSWADLGEMAAAGIEWGSHGRRHVSLPGLPEREAWDEVRGSRVDLERTMGRPVRLFAYPYGDCDTGAAALLARAGYTAACGIQHGLNDPTTPLFQLRRTEIRGGYSLFRFMLAVRTGRPWVLRAPRWRRQT